jgi:cyclomaltodextrinase / maltogenic alpha-amylase / neopullulanase
MNFAAIMHQTSKPWLTYLPDNSVEIRLQSAKDLTNVELLFGDTYQWVKDQNGHFHWQMLPPLTPKYKLETKWHIHWIFIINNPPKRLKYFFKFNNFIYGEDGILSDSINLTDRLGFFFPYLHVSTQHHIPTWVNDTIWYQIFVDRFHRTGEVDNFRKWSDEPASNKYFYGGNLPGIISQLPYLKNLGISGIYLTPIFLSPTVHKYDTMDYYLIDPAFGTKEDLMSLVQQCHNLGMKIILDGVFNHGSELHPFFLDYQAKGKDSAYAHYFLGSQAQYEVFAQEKHMPKWNTQHPEVREYLVGVAKYYLQEFKIDGWRFDVANEVDHLFWKVLRQECIAINQDIYLCGEVLSDGKDYLLGDEFDAIMNYDYQHPIKQFLLDPDYTNFQFTNHINQISLMYSTPVMMNNFNFLVSHDKMRTLNIFHNDLSLVLKAYAIFMTMNGSNCLYYGEEIPLAGGNDPDNRRCMDFTRINSNYFSLYQQLILLRNQYPALRHGNYHPVDTADPKLLHYQKSLTNETLGVIVNMSNQPLPAVDGLIVFEAQDIIIYVKN